MIPQPAWLQPPLLGILIGLFPVAASAQAQEKPSIEARTRAAEISVTIDRKLKAYTPLASDLLAEGRRFVASTRAETDSEYKNNRGYFADGRKYSYERSYEFRSLIANRYLSVVRADHTFTGGAHPNTLFNTILWDSAHKKRISVRPFFSEAADNGPTMTALATLVRRAVAIEKRERREGVMSEDEKKEVRPSLDEAIAQDSQLRDAIQPSLLKLGPITLAPSTTRGKSSGLTFHFSPYDVDAYAAGPYTVFVTWDDLKPHLSGEGRAIFGGERPEKDKEQ